MLKQHCKSLKLAFLQCPLESLQRKKTGIPTSRVPAVKELQLYGE